MWEEQISQRHSRYLGEPSIQKRWQKIFKTWAGGGQDFFNRKPKVNLSFLSMTKSRHRAIKRRQITRPKRTPSPSPSDALSHGSKSRTHSGGSHPCSQKEQQSFVCYDRAPGGRREPIARGDGHWEGAAFLPGGLANRTRCMNIHLEKEQCALTCHMTNSGSSSICSPVSPLGLVCEP